MQMIAPLMPIDWKFNDFIDRGFETNVNDITLA